MRSKVDCSNIPILFVVDSLAIGGAERMAVSIANALPQPYEVHLCCTRADGPLLEELDPHVRVLQLNRKKRFDISAISRLRNYIIRNNICIIHAHSSSVFVSLVSAWQLPTQVIWHIHSGGMVREQKRLWHYRIAARIIKAIIVVNKALEQWVHEQLGFKTKPVCYIPNFVTFERSSLQMGADIPGTSGKRIVCVANIRPEKDILTLLKAMKLTVEQIPEAHLILIGNTLSSDYVAVVKNSILELKLHKHVSLLGQQNPWPILLGCDIGVLSSMSEGLPVSLLEYGAAKLATVATDVGQCSDVLNNGQAGMLVPAQSAGPLADALIELLNSPQKRMDFANRFHNRVMEFYSPKVAIEQISNLYNSILPH